MFFVFRDSYVLSLWTFDVRFTHSHIIAMVHMRKHSQHNKDERTHFFRKIYLSHFIRKGYESVIVWEVSWRLNKDCNILTPSSSGYSSTSFSSCGAAQLGTPRVPLSAWSGSHCFELQPLTPNSDLQLTDFLSHPGYIIVCRPPASCGVTIRTQFNLSTVKVIPWYLRPDAPVIYTGAFFTGSEVNMLHVAL